MKTEGDFTAKNENIVVSLAIVQLADHLRAGESSELHQLLRFVCVLFAHQLQDVTICLLC